MGNRYKVWRLHSGSKPAVYVLIVADPPEGPETNWHAHVPEPIRSLGFWAGGIGGRLALLKPLYRAQLAAHGFVVFGKLPTQVQLERPPRHRIRLKAGRFKPTLAPCQRSNSSPQQSP